MEVRARAGLMRVVRVRTRMVEVRAKELLLGP